MDSDQKTLTEQLQILNLLHGKDLGASYLCIEYHYDKSDKVFNAELRALDLVALLLTTGGQEDLTAVTLDRRTGLELVIAKNRPPTSADDAAVKNLISVLLNAPDDSDPKSIFPSVMTHCIRNINKRLLRLNQSLSQFLPIIEQKLQRHPPHDDELPGSKAYLDKFYPDSKPDMKVIISELFQFCFTHSQHPLDTLDKDGSYKRYSDLCLGAGVLLRCGFLGEIFADYHFHHPGKEREVTKLKRCLAKVCQYLVDIGPLVRGVKNWFRNGEIPYRWVDVPTIFGRREGLVEISPSLKDALSCSAITNPEKSIQHISEKYPSLFERWSSSVHTYIHPEIQIVADIHPPTSTDFDGDMRAIGCSKRSCFCCTAWIESFDCFFRTSWHMNEAHGKVYADWQLPSLGYKYYEMGDIDSEVIMKARNRLQWCGWS